GSSRQSRDGHLSDACATAAPALRRARAAAMPRRLAASRGRLQPQAPRRIAYGTTRPRGDDQPAVYHCARIDTAVLRTAGGALPSSRTRHAAGILDGRTLRYAVDTDR